MYVHRYFEFLETIQQGSLMLRANMSQIQQKKWPKGEFLWRPKCKKKSLEGIPKLGWGHLFGKNPIFWCPSSAVMIMIMMSSDAEKKWNYFFCISSVLSTTCCCIPFSAFSHFFPHSLEPIKTFFWHSIHFLQWILFLKTFLSCKTVLVSFIIYIFSRGRLWWWP